MTEDLPEIPEGRRDDLIGLEDLERAGLILFMAGNQFMAVPDLLEAFLAENPGLGPVFCETLPPGLELRQILAGGAIFKGKRLPGTPDLYTSVSSRAMESLRAKGMIEDYVHYLGNRLVIMVAEGNPLGITRVEDLGRPGIRVSEPGEMEDIRAYVSAMYSEAGGDELIRKIREEKVETGESMVTTVHHRETPERILNGEADAGPLWATELLHAKESGLRVEGVEPGERFDQRGQVRYYACVLKNAPHPGAGRAFLDFLLSPVAGGIYGRHGFLVP